MEKRSNNNMRPAARRYTRGARIGGIMQGIGRVGGMVARELTKPAPSRNTPVSSGSQYASFHKWGKGGMPVHDALRLVRGARMSQAEKKKAEVLVETLGRKDRTEFVSAKKLAAAQQRIEELVGREKAGKFFRALDMGNPHGIFGGGRMVSGKKVGEHIRGMGNILSKEDRSLLAMYAEGLDQKSHLSHQKGLLEEEFVQGLEQGGFSKGAVHELGKTFLQKSTPDKSPVLQRYASGTLQGQRNGMEDSQPGAGLNRLARR